MPQDDTPRGILSAILARHCDASFDGLDSGSRFSMFASPGLLCREIRQSFPEHFQAARWQERDGLAEVLSGLSDRDGARFLPDATPRRVFDAVCSRFELFQDRQASRGEPSGEGIQIARLEELASQLEDLLPAGRHPTLRLIDCNVAKEIAAHLRDHARLLQDPLLETPLLEEKPSPGDGEQERRAGPSDDGGPSPA